METVGWPEILPAVFLCFLQIFFPDFRIGTPSGFLDCRVKYPLLVTYPLSPSHLASSLTFSSFTATVTSLDLLFMLCVQGIEETVDSR